MSFPSLGTTYHRTSYPAISPSQPALSQAGRTILITGGGGGIGFEIARSFAKASASRVIIVGRRAAFLNEAVSNLQQEFGAKGVTEFIARQGDIGDDASISSLWEYLHSQGIFVNVLVLNAALFVSSGIETLLLDKDQFMQAFQVNLGGNFLMTTKFVHQSLRPSITAADHQLYLINISTAQIHMYPSTDSDTYGTSKAAWTAMLSRIADQSKVDELQIISYHPGVVYSEGVSKLVSKDLLNWDDMSLPADYAVWAASSEASWLHGRFVWAHWDVDELRAAATDATSEVGKQMKDNAGYLKVGVLGLPSVSLKGYMKE
ncbi:hypothetical protein D9757_005014 [Collybiopsis confluens]|uniref:Uncharacterized protein n=1 Tax=Collybiopsis confluens TaxID=2823264 RepID=A0A8H5CLD1_9AGAR|nr:hypothetical protein D9757_014905 [Collybiopsis confluens]KAF5389033.1 hypothetical protein D9757_005014 [Collybiopsis confluens]